MSSLSSSGAGSSLFGSGTGSPEAEEWQAAVTEAIACSRDTRSFVNNSEVVLARLHRALLHLSSRKFSDEAAILGRIADKHTIVHFLLDCVRNRFLAWRKVSYIRDLLVDRNSQWRSAFSEHIATCATCKTVDLSRGGRRTPGAPPVRWPIPFALELLALVGLGQPLLGFALGCSCAGRAWLLALGILLLLPFLGFELLWRYRKPEVLWLLAQGPYAVGAQRRSVSPLWYPQRRLLLDPAPASAAAGSGLSASRPRPSATGESHAASVEVHPVGYRMRGLSTFGEWWKDRPAPTASIDVPVGDETCCRLTRFSVELARQPPLLRSWAPEPGAEQAEGAPSGRPKPPGRSPVASSSASLSSEGRDMEVSCLSRGWQRRAARLLPEGVFEGLLPSGAAVFDGDALYFRQGGAQHAAEGEVWAKLGFWRLSLLRKLFVSLAMFGVLLAASVCELPPGILQCNRAGGHVTAPFDVFFLLDASGSITEEAWRAEKDAATDLLNAFQGNYAGPVSGLRAGVAQFSTGAHLEANLTSDVDRVKQRLGRMTQAGGGTRFGPPLQTCQEQMSRTAPGAAAAAMRHAQVCVLLTDGATSDAAQADKQKSLLRASSIDIMGIYVGSSEVEEGALRSFVCGENSDCIWFARAANFRELQKQAAQIARSIATHAGRIDLDGCRKPYWTLFGLFFILPAAAWWMWLHGLFTHRQESASPDRPRQNPLRLRAAGANEPRHGGGAAAAP